MKKRNTRRTMKGGFLENLAGLGDSFSQGATSLWEKAKNAASSLTSRPSTSSYTSTGGKRSRRRRMRGGFEDNTPLTGLASNADNYSGPTAKPNNLVGGKTKRRRRRTRKH
jgi:hypothetical protein